MPRDLPRGDGLARSALACAAAVAAAPAQAQDTPSETLGSVLSDWVEVVESASIVLVFVASCVGIALVAWSVFQMATEPTDDERWRHVGGLAVGSLFTIFAVVVGAFSRLLMP